MKIDFVESVYPPFSPEKPFDLRQGNSPVVLMGPHTGRLVPRELYKNGLPLGLPPEYFEPGHPACHHDAVDIGTMAFLSQIATKLPEATIITSPISRLVADLNRMPEHAISGTMDETGEEIPANLDMSNEQKQERLKKFYDPYHDALGAAIDHVRKIHGGAIVLDMHSCTPFWRGEQRSDAQIGVIFFEENPLADRTLEVLSAQSDFNIAPNYPYDLIHGPLAYRNAGKKISADHNVHYVAIEIRNDLLRDPASLEKTASLMANLTAQLERSPNIHLLMNRQQTTSVPSSDTIFRGNFSHLYT